MKTVSHWINGSLSTDKPSQVGEIFNPATGKISGTVNFADLATVNTAVTYSCIIQLFHSAVIQLYHITGTFINTILLQMYQATVKCKCHMQLYHETVICNYKMPLYHPNVIFSYTIQLIHSTIPYCYS